MALGIPSFDPTLSRQAMSMQSDLLQGLGRQIKADINTVVTNRQLKGLAQGLQSVDTTSPQFGRQIVGLMSEYPLAVQSPIGQAAITQLGSEFKLNQQKEIAREAFGNRIGMETLRDYRDRRDYGAPPMTRGEAEAVASGTVEPIMPGTPPSATGDPGTVYQPTGQLESLPTAGSVDLFGDKQFLQQTGGQPSIPAAQPTAIPGLERLMQTRQAVAKLPRKEGEAAMRAAAAQLGRAPAVRANITNADGTIWSQLQDGSMIPAVDPRTGQQMKAIPRSGGANSDRDKMMTLRNQIAREYAEENAKAAGEGQVWLTAEKQGIPEASKRRAVAMGARARAASLKAQLDELDTQLKGSTTVPVEVAATSVTAAPTPAGEIVSVTSAAEAMSLPRGTKFRDPSGNIRIVP